MKNISILVCILVMSFSLVAQNEIEIHLDYDPGVIYNSQTIVHTSTSSSFYVYMRVINKTNSDLELIYRRVILNSNVDFFDQFCDQNLCHPCSGLDWSSPSETPTVISPNDSTLMKPQGSFLDEGSALIRYYVIDNSNSEILDSVDLNLIYSSITGVDSSKFIKTTEYPNPANQFFNIEVQNSVESKFILYTITGDKVYENNLLEGYNKINLSKFSSGMYLYSIISGTETVKTKRLIVK